MRLLFAVVVLALIGAAAAAEPDPAIEAEVFATWCKQSALTSLDTAVLNQQNKRTAYNKIFTTTQEYSGQLEKARDEYDGHKLALSKTEHLISSLEKRISQAENKKATIKRNLNGKYDSINWNKEKSVVDNAIAALIPVHDSTTVDLAKSTLNSYKNGIDNAVARVSKLEAKVEDFEKQKRDATAKLTSLQAGTARYREAFQAATTQYEAQKKISDAAESDLARADKAVHNARNAQAACIHKGHLPPLPEAPSAPAAQSSAAKSSTAKSSSPASPAVTKSVTPAPAPAAATQTAAKPEKKKTLKLKLKLKSKKNKAKPQKKRSKNPRLAALDMDDADDE